MLDHPKGGPVDEETSDEQNALQILLVQITSNFFFWKILLFPALCFSEDLHSTGALFSASCAPDSGAQVCLKISHPFVGWSALTTSSAVLKIRGDNESEELLAEEEDLHSGTPSADFAAPPSRRRIRLLAMQRRRPCRGRRPIP
jgi:hypothetical protein